MASVTSAAPLHVGPRGRDSVHVDCKELSTGTGEKRLLKIQEFIGVLICHY